MPTQKRRLTITLGDENYELLHRLSELGGQSISSLIVELVDSARPILAQLVEAAERYQELDADKRRAAQAAFEADHDRLVPQMEQLLDGVKSMNDQTIDAFKRVK